MSDTKRDFKFFRNFLNEDEAAQFSELLDANNVPYLLETTGTLIDKVIVGDGLVPKAILKIHPDDFKKVNKIISEDIEKLTPAELREHYLSQLNNQELLDIFNRPDEWTIEDINIARLILKYRGVNISTEEIESLRTARFNEIRKGKKANILWLMLYFLFIVCGFFIGIVFAVAGFGMGYYYAYGRSTDPDGERYFTYDATTRKAGKFILFGGLIVILIEIVLLWLWQ